MLRSLFAAFLLVAVSAPAPATTPNTGAPPAVSAYSTGVPPAAQQQNYTTDELINAGHEFFGQTSSNLAAAMTQLFSQFGLPNGYVLGEEGSGAFLGGLRYGEGALQVAGGTPQPVFWQGPSFGWDFGGSGSRVMMLVYNLKSTNDLMQRFTGVDGSAYLVGGVSMTVMAGNETFIVPVRTGVGVRLGASLGYLKFTQQPTWNPF